jgi:hypothetical protein
VPQPSGDPYRIGGIEAAVLEAPVARKLGKLAFQILINAQTAKAAHGAITALIVELGLQGRADSKLVVRAIKARFSEFGTFWHTGIGLRLQRTDSDIAADVMRQLRAKAIPVLGVHDSFLVPAKDRSALLEVMDSAFAAGLRRAPALTK